MHLALTHPLAPIRWPLPPPPGSPPLSLLQAPHRLESLVAVLVDAVGGEVPVSVKMRSGFEDTALFEDNLMAIQVRGVKSLCFVLIAITGGL